MTVASLGNYCLLLSLYGRYNRCGIVRSRSIRSSTDPSVWHGYITIDRWISIYDRYIVVSLTHSRKEPCNWGTTVALICDCDLVIISALIWRAIACSNIDSYLIFPVITLWLWDNRLISFLTTLLSADKTLATLNIRYELKTWISLLPDYSESAIQDLNNNL